MLNFSCFFARLYWSWSGLPESTSLSSQLRARKDQVNIQTPYGPLILSMTFPCEESELRIPMANPLAYLWQICQGAGGFVEFMRRKIRDAAEDEPWGSSSTPMMSVSETKEVSTRARHARSIGPSSNLDIGRCAMRPRGFTSRPSGQI